MLETLLWYILIPIGFYWIITWFLEKKQIEGLNRKVVLITGCDSGFGRDLVFKCSDAGMPVLAACLTDFGVESLKKEAKGPGVVTPFKMDVRSDESIEAAKEIVEEITKKYGGLHGIVNNAGITGASLWDDLLNVKDYIDVMDVNLNGVVRVTHAFMHLIKKAKGRIVTTASVCGRVALPLLGPYTCSKYAVEAYCDTLRIENAIFGVSVSIIEPGFFKTTLTDPKRITKVFDDIWKRTTKEKRDEYGDKVFECTKNEMITMLSERCNKNTYLVVNAYFHALTSARPRARYPVGLDANLIYIPVSFLPAPVTDFIFAAVRIIKQFPKPAILQK
jgi:17beta-estradiol 17-dehydrogenase/all-trans-retinol dehydrogenase (NAD+)/3alpha(17beta)-hydroxysteroid dehydrogenase (NAD+)